MGNIMPPCVFAKTMISTGADVNETDFDGTSPLHYAVTNETSDKNDSTTIDLDLSLEIMLIQNGANVFSEINGRYPLHLIFRSIDDGNFEKVQSKDPVYILMFLKK